MTVYIMPIHEGGIDYFVVRPSIERAIERAQKDGGIGKIFAVELPDDAHEIPVIRVEDAVAVAIPIPTVEVNEVKA